MRDLAHFRLLRLLGEGGQGRTFLALDTRLMRRVVIKVFHNGGDVKQRRLLETEARRLAQLDGPRVVAALDVVSSGAELAIVLRYVPGCSLEDLLRQRPLLTPFQALTVLTDLAAALAAARQQVLVHGDLKASNVLLARDGRALLCDFGIAVAAGRRALAASEEALTPEHCRGEPLTQQSDFFALGILAWRMLVGRHPFAMGSGVDRERLVAGLPEDLPLPVGLPAAAEVRMKRLLRELLAADPAQRPAGTAALRNELRELRTLLPAGSGLARDVAALARSEQLDPQVPELPLRLTQPPRRERWWATARRAWSAATLGARAMFVGALAIAAALPVLYLQRPGPCVSIAPVTMDIAPHLAQLLPPAAAIETHMLRNLKRHAAPVLVIGNIEGSDSRISARIQGLRDICVAERQLQLNLRCWDARCRLLLTSQAPGAQRQTSLTLPADSGLQRVQHAVDQLMAGHLDTLLPR